MERERDRDSKRERERERKSYTCSLLDILFVSQESAKPV